MQTVQQLIDKYDVACPRYTSYPTVPYWDNQIDENDWKKNVFQTYQKHKKEGISVYIHLPYCEKLCTYCGCNKRITLNHKVEQPYIETLLKEWKMYVDLLGEKPKIAELHLGGGTPTFFSAENLRLLIEGILQNAILTPHYEMSLEVHPNYTQKDQLQALYEVGFRRLSVGIQDFDERVQFVINRPQTFEQTKRVFEEARAIGYTSINADIIYGLPLQTLESVKNTIECVKKLAPERIAFYSYAHVPWKSPAQRRYTEADLPKAEEKRNLYEKGREALLEMGYIDIGLDHFALPNDELYKATQTETLHRNFMGYTTQHTQLMIGLGASSISDSWGAFAQNIKEVEAYQEAVEQGKFPIFKGHVLNNDDLMLRKHILNIMCLGKTNWQYETHPIFQEIAERLEPLAADGLLKLMPYNLEVTEIGRLFLRNIALQFDQHFWEKTMTEKVFSKAI